MKSDTAMLRWKNKTGFMIAVRTDLLTKLVLFLSKDVMEYSRRGLVG